MRAACGPRPASGAAKWRHVPTLATFLGVLWLLAYAEEMIWDRAVWHDHGWLFGNAWDVGDLKIVLVPLLALPQLTHYILDGFIWKRPTGARGGMLAVSPPPARR